MIPRIKVRTEFPYLINANVWGKEDENNSSIYKLWRTLSTSLFLFKQPMNQHYVAIGCKNHNLLNLLLYWKTQRSQPENQSPSNFREPRLYLCRQCCRLVVLPRATALPPSLPGPCSGLLRAITNTFLCQVSSTPAQFPSAAHQVPGSAQGREQTAGSRGRAALLLLLAASTSLRFMMLGENNHLMHSIHSPPMFL